MVFTHSCAPPPLGLKLAMPRMPQPDTQDPDTGALRPGEAGSRLSLSKSWEKGAGGLFCPRGPGA